MTKSGAFAHPTRSGTSEKPQETARFGGGRFTRDAASTLIEPLNPNELLTALRKAAESGDWNGCRSAATALGSLMAPRQLVDLACIEVRRRLPAFLRHQPGATWPERLLASIDAGEVPTPAMLPIEDYDAPGANNYHAALEMLMEAALHRDDPARLVADAVDAIASAIMAGMAENWGSRNRERWDRWYQAAGSDEPIEDMHALTALVHMKNDPEVGAMRRQSWLDVADAFERALRAQGPWPLRRSL